MNSSKNLDKFCFQKLTYVCREVSLTFVALLLCSLISYAETPGDSLDYEYLPELTVNSISSSRDVRSSSPLHQILSSQLKIKGINGISDAMRRLPGITLKDYGGAGGMKTVAVQGMGAQHTGVALDGIPLSDARSGQIDLNRFSLDNVGSLSLSIGNSDDIFIPARNAATPSLLSLSSFLPALEGNGPNLKVKFRFGSFQLLESSLRYEQNLSPSFSLGADFSFTHAKNDYPFTLHNLSVTTHERRSNSRMNSYSGDIHSRWSINSSSSLSAKIYYYDNDRQLPGQVRYYTTHSSETLHDRNFFIQSSFRSSLSSIFSLRADARYNWDSSDYKDPSYSSNLRDAKYLQREAYFSSTLLASIIHNLQLSYALDYSYQNMTSNASLTTDRHPIRNSILQALSARWTPWRFSITGRLLGSLYYNSTKSGNSAKNARKLSPALSASFKLLENEDFFVRAGYKNIFRLPTFTESYFFHLGSSELRPESTIQYNLGLTYGTTLFDNRDISWTLSATADTYINYVKDMILAIPFNMFIWTNMNVGKVRANGVDINLSSDFQPAKNHKLSLALNWSLQSATDRTPNSNSYGKRIAYIPLNSGGGSLSWENPWFGITLSGNASSRRWSTNDHTEYTDIKGYTELNATLFKTIIFNNHHSVDLRFDIRNMLNTRYELVRLYPMPGINYACSVTYLLQ